MVVFEDALPVKSQYRRFKIKTIDGQDDFAAMEEVLRRRFEAYLAERNLPIEEQGRFSYPPGLIVIDGGKGQLSRAVGVLSELDLRDPIDRVGQEAGGGVRSWKVGPHRDSARGRSPVSPPTRSRRSTSICDHLSPNTEGQVDGRLHPR